jgi:hypothetical protein
MRECLHCLHPLQFSVLPALLLRKIKILPRAGVIIDGVLYWWLDLLTPYTLTDLHTLQFTITHTSVLSLLVSTIRFLATAFNTATITVSLNYTLQISLTTAHVKSSNHTPSLLFTGWPSSLNWTALNNSDASIPQFNSQAHILAGLRLGTQLPQTTQELELLYDWRFTTNQFVLATSPLRLTTSNCFPPTEHLRS